MHRMDRQLRWMSMNEATGMVRPEDVAARESELLPSYQPLGEIFCDLHDRPERMLAKGVIRDIVPWKDCRAYFYWRLKRRVEELRLIDALVESGAMVSDELAARAVQRCVPKTGGDRAAYDALAGLKPSDVDAA